jgi:hypothetical protein
MTGANLEPQPQLSVIGVLQLLPGGEQTSADPLDNRQIIRLGGHRLGDSRIIGIVHHYQLFGWKVPEERHLGDPGRGGDVCDCRLVVAALSEQPQCLPLETRPRSRRLTHNRMLASNILKGKDGRDTVDLLMKPIQWWSCSINAFAAS